MAMISDKTYHKFETDIEFAIIWNVIDDPMCIGSDVSFQDIRFQISWKDFLKITGEVMEEILECYNV
jgi:hypothetical protein